MGGSSSKVTAQDKCAFPINGTELRGINFALLGLVGLTLRAYIRAILDMKNQRDKLHQYQRRITVLTDKETEIARQMLAQGDKKRALLALRRKKYQDSLLAKTDAQLEQLEQLTSNVEFAQIQKDVVFGLQQGTKVLREIHTEMGGIEHVEKLMGDTADAIAYQKEVSEMLGGRITNQDEAEVEDELAALQEELAGASQDLPAVPNARLPESRRETENRTIEANQLDREAMLAS